MKSGVSGVWGSLEPGFFWSLDSSGVWSLRSGVWSLESEVRRLGSEVWSLKSGGWGLESGVRKASRPGAGVAPRGRGKTHLVSGPGARGAIGGRGLRVRGRESGVGSRESGVGSRESGVGKASRPGAGVAPGAGARLIWSQGRAACRGLSQEQGRAPGAEIWGRGLRRGRGRAEVEAGRRVAPGAGALWSQGRAACRGLSQEGVKAGRRGCPKGPGRDRARRPGAVSWAGACVASRESGRPRPGAGVAPGAETRLFEPPGLRSQGGGQGRVKAGGRGQDWSAPRPGQDIFEDR